MKDYIKEEKQKRLKGYLSRHNIYPFSLNYMYFKLLHLSKNWYYRSTRSTNTKYNDRKNVTNSRRSTKTE